MTQIGLLSYSTNTGLGIQTKALYDNLKPSKTLCIDLSVYNQMEQHPAWYPDASFCKGYPSNDDIDNFLEGLDCVLVAETPLNYYLFSRAKELGIKTIQIPNYEFFDYFWYPDAPKPSMIILPSLWHFDYFKGFCNKNGIYMQYIHHPVDREALPFREINKARTFIHIAGRVAAYDRNGTEIVKQAIPLLKSKAKVKILDQSINPVKNYWELYKTGDVLVLPRRYGGNCLPLNEALSVGMPVIMTDVEPNNRLLPRNWLVKAEKTASFAPRAVVDIYSCTPQDLADKIDEFYDNDELMELENKQADLLASSFDWNSMKREFMRTIEWLISQS